jgi:hypothetical protein
MLDKSKFDNKKELRKFAAGLCICLAITGTTQLIRGNNYFYYFYLAIPLVSVIGIFIPITLKPIYILFSYFIYSLSGLITIVILFILYFFIFTPLSVIKRLSKDQMIKLKFQKSQKSYWEDCHEDEKERIENYENQY